MGQVDDFERLLDDLIEAGVFETSTDGELKPTESFRRSREAARAEVAALDDEAFDSTRSTYAGDDVSPSDVGADALGDAVAIYETAESLDRERCLLAALALDRIEATAREPGVPEGFVPIDGDAVDGFMAAHPAAVIYFWREDCEPCDGVRATLETLLADGAIPPSVGLGAVYGPDWADLIRERYQVGVAPTTLFCVDGRIDSRLVGHPGPAAFETEIGMIAPASE